MRVSRVAAVNNAGTERARGGILRGLGEAVPGDDGNTEDATDAAEDEGDDAAGREAARPALIGCLYNMEAENRGQETYPDGRGLEGSFSPVRSR